MLCRTNNLTVDPQLLTMHNITSSNVAPLLLSFSSELSHYYTKKHSSFYIVSPCHSLATPHEQAYDNDLNRDTSFSTVQPISIDTHIVPNFVTKTRLSGHGCHILPSQEPHSPSPHSIRPLPSNNIRPCPSLAPPSLPLHQLHPRPDVSPKPLHQHQLLPPTTPRHHHTNNSPLNVARYRS